MAEMNIFLEITTSLDCMLKAKFAYSVKRGMQESAFLRHLNIDLKDLEPKADSCTKVYVWHTRSEKVNMSYESKRQSLLLPPSNMGIIV